MRGGRGMSQDKKGSGCCTFPPFHLPHSNLSWSVKIAAICGSGQCLIPPSQSSGRGAGAGGCSGCCCGVAAQPDPALAAGRVSQSLGHRCLQVPQHCPCLPAERILPLPVSLATQSHKHQVVGARRDRGIGQIGNLVTGYKYLQAEPQLYLFCCIRGTAATEPRY